MAFKVISELILWQLFLIFFVDGASEVKMTLYW